MPTSRKNLRALLQPERFSSIAGAYDMLSARLATQAGCQVIHVGGYNLSAVKLGLPDVGLLTLTETLDSVSRIAGATDVPVIADGDDGYGNHLNVTRLIKELERAGVAGVHIEDQVFPKRCGHMVGKRIVSSDKMVQKIKAAVDARIDGDFVIIARTDAIAVEGFEAAMDRAQAYREAGADMLFVEAPMNDEQIAAIPRLLKAPTLFNWCHGGMSPTPSVGAVRELGYSMILFTDLLFAVAQLLGGIYKDIASNRGYGNHVNSMMPLGDFNKMIGLDEISALDLRFDRP